MLYEFMTVRLKVAMIKVDYKGFKSMDMSSRIWTRDLRFWRPIACDAERCMDTVFFGMSVGK